MASAANNSSTTVGGTTHTQAGRNSIRQTRTNPSRTSKTVARSFSLYGHSSVADAPPTPAVPHGFFPALTHFTDAITALPREFRRHNSLLKEVDAKAWALEENLQQLLSVASESDPVHCPPNPAPIVDGVVREYAVPQVSCNFVILKASYPSNTAFHMSLETNASSVIGCDAARRIPRQQRSQDPVRSHQAHPVRLDDDSR